MSAFVDTKQEGSGWKFSTNMKQSNLPSNSIEN